MTRRHADPLNRRLTAADPAARSRPEAGALEPTLDQLGAAITATPRPAPAHRSRGRRPRRVFLAAAAATALLAGGATAATTLLSARTGQRATGWQIKAGGPGEYLRLGAPDFCRVALQVSAGIPFPPGDQSWRRWVLIGTGVKRVNPSGSCDSQTQGGRAEVSTGALRGTFAQSAFCAWVYDWRHTVRTPTRAGLQTAVSEIDAAPRWNAVTAEDPHPSAGPLHETRYGLNGRHSLFGWLLPFRSAVDHGDVRTVDELIASTYGDTGCRFLVPPAASHGGTVNPLAAKS